MSNNSEPWNRLFPSTVEPNFYSSAYWQNLLIICTLTAGIPFLLLLVFFLANLYFRFTDVVSQFRNRKRGTYVILLAVLALLQLAILAVQLVGNFTFSTIIAQAGQALYTAWEEVYIGSHAIYVHLLALRHVVPLNTTLLNEVEIIIKDANRSRIGNHQEQVFFLNLGRYTLQYLSWAITTSSAGLAIVTAISRRNKLPRIAGYVSVVAGIFLIFSCAVHFPLVVLWDGVCAGLFEKKLPPSMVAIQNVTESAFESWDDYYCHIYRLSESLISRAEEVSVTCFTHPPFHLIFPPCVANLTLNDVHAAVEIWEQEKGAIIKACGGYGKLPLAIYNATKLADQMANVLFEMKKLMTGEIVAHLADGLRKAPCAHSGASSMLMLIGMIFSALIAFATAFFSFRASHIFTEDVSAKLADIDLLITENSLTVVDDTGLKKWENIKASQKAAQATSCMLLFLAMAHISTVSWQFGDPSVTVSTLSILTATILVSAIGSVVVWNQLANCILAYAISNVILVIALGVVVYKNAWILINCNTRLRLSAEDTTSGCVSDFDKAISSLSLIAGIVDILFMIATSAASFIFYRKLAGSQEQSQVHHIAPSTVVNTIQLQHTESGSSHMVW